MGIRIAGRAKGTPNKRTLEAAERLKRFKDPLSFMATVMEDESVDILHRLSAARELAQYLYPKRKAIELSGEGESGEVVGKVALHWIGVAAPVTSA